MDERTTQTANPLLALPPELRNIIYEMAMQTYSDEPIDLVAAPQKLQQLSALALLLTCRQVSSETAGLYKIACRKFWQASTFELELSRWPRDRMGVHLFGACKSSLNLIMKLEVRDTFPHDLRRYEYLGSGAWKGTWVEKQEEVATQYLAFTVNESKGKESLVNTLSYDLISASLQF